MAGQEKGAPKNFIDKKKIIIISFLALLLVFVFSIFTGRFSLSLSELSQSFLQLSQGLKPEEIDNQTWRVFYFIRLPRILMVIAVGSALSATGAVYQSIFYNPLISPDILGVSAGAGFGVALGMLFGGGSLIHIYIPAFISGLIAVALTYYINKLSRGHGIMKMVLAGIVVSSLFNALLAILKYLADPMDQLPGIVFWLMGGFSRAGWQEVKLVLPFVLTGLIIIFYFRWYLNVISMGEEEALSLGINVKTLRVLLILFSTMMVSAAVATTGQITWIGLIVPHIARFIIGSDHRMMIPTTMILGATLLLLMDDLARVLIAAEIPISIITALIGAPFFAYLLITRGESGWS
ncbi:MAG: FecCD family ABC transporter permease [Bacillota bacterium]